MPTSQSNEQTETGSNAATVVTLATSMGVGTFRSPDDSWPPITEKGTELTAGQAEAAEAAAKAMRFRLRVVGEDKRKAKK